MADHNAVLVVADVIFLTEIEFGHLDFEAVADRAAVEFLEMPFQHLPHVFDHRLRAELRRAAGRAGDAQRLEAQTGRGRERQHVGKVGVVIDMQVGEENVVHQPDRQLQGDDVAHAAGAEVEEEALSVAELDHDAGRPAWSRRGGHGALPTKEIRISSSPSSSVPG